MDLTESLEKFLAGEEERFELGVVGGSDEHSDDPAVVFVSAPAEALKSARGNLIEESVDRDQVWEVRGFSLSRRVVDTLDPAPETIDELVEAVKASGEDWSVIETTGDPATPST